MKKNTEGKIDPLSNFKFRLEQQQLRCTTPIPRQLYTVYLQKGSQILLTINFQKNQKSVAKIHEHNRLFSIFNSYDEYNYSLYKKDPTGKQFLLQNTSIKFQQYIQLYLKDYIIAKKSYQQGLKERQKNGYMNIEPISQWVKYNSNILNNQKFSVEFKESGIVFSFALFILSPEEQNWEKYQNSNKKPRRKGESRLTDLSKSLTIAVMKDQKLTDLMSSSGFQIPQQNDEESSNLITSHPVLQMDQQIHEQLQQQSSKILPPSGNAQALCAIQQASQEGSSNINDKSDRGYKQLQQQQDVINQQITEVSFSKKVFYRHNTEKGTLIQPFNNSHEDTFNSIDLDQKNKASTPQSKVTKVYGFSREDQFSFLKSQQYLKSQKLIAEQAEAKKGFTKKIFMVTVVIISLFLIFAIFSRQEEVKTKPPSKPRRKKNK